MSSKRLHEFTVAVINKKLEDLGVDSEHSVRITIDLDEICAFYETTHEKTDQPGTQIDLKSGEGYAVFETYDIVKALI